MEEWEKKSRSLRNENSISRNIKEIFFSLIDFQGKFVKTEFHDPKKFKTKNRKDIDLYVKFLEDVIERKISIEETEAFKKISLNANPSKNHIAHMNHLLDLCDEIKKHGIKKPLIVAKFKSPSIKIWHWSNGEKIWKDFKNETGFQLIEGTHRLPIAIYLNLEKVPVKFYKPIFTQIPNFTDLLNITD